MKNKIMILMLCLAAGLFSVPNAHADSSSANYGLSEDRFTGGGGNASSANYQLAETSFDFFSGQAASSSNYAVDPKVGISSASNLVSINSITPSDFSKYYSDASASYTVTAVDP